MTITRRTTVSLSAVRAVIHQHRERTRDRNQSIIKNGPKSTVYLLPVVFEGKERTLCLKTYLVKGWLNSLKQICRPSRAMGSLRAAETLRREGIKTAAPLAVVDKKRGFLPMEAMLVMENISEFPGLPEYIEEHFPPSPSKKQIEDKRTFIKLFAFFLKNLHDKGIYQNDFKTTNIFVEEPVLAKESFWLIDLDQVFFSKKVSWRRKIKNLCQINTSIPWQITLTDRLRFFHWYTGKSRLEKADKKTLKESIRLSWKRNPRWHPRFKMDAKTIRNWQ